MTDMTKFESRLEARLIARAAIAVRPFDAAGITRTAALAGGNRRGSRWPGVPLLRVPRPVLFLLLVGLLLAIAAATLIGASLLRRPERLPGAIYPTGQMSTPRVDTADALLEDGRILFAGGTTNGQGADPIRGEVFDPATNLFSPTQAMVQARSSASATTLVDGRVLIAGGSFANSAGGVAMSTAEVFDPRSGSFAPTGTMRDPRIGPLAVRLADGRVLVVGGTLTEAGGTNEDLASAEVYDPVSGAWSNVGPMPAGRTAVGASGHGRPTATLLPDGRVLVAGGRGADGPLASALLFDPRTDTFILTEPMTFARSNASATVLADGRVLIVGGDATRSKSAPQVQALASTELFDPATGRFTLSGSLSTERFGHSATLLPDGRVLVAGGTNAYGGPLSTELYDPATGTFSQGPTAASGHSEFGALLPDGRVFLAGDQPELFDPAARAPSLVAASRNPDRTFTLTGDPVQDRSDHTATMLMDGRVLITGGLSPDGTGLSSAEAYDPRSNSFSATGSMAGPRLGAVALRLADGHVLIVGGSSSADFFSHVPPNQDVEIYDPASGRFVTGGSLDLDPTRAVDGIDAVETPGGQILLFVADPSLVVGLGGVDTVVYSLDPTRLAATRVSILPDCYVATGDASLRDGLVMLFCPDAAGATTLRLYDPASRRLTALDLPLSEGSVVPLADGRALIYSLEKTDSVVVFDPESGTIADTGAPLLEGGESMTLLADGRVLFLGSDAYIWDPRTGRFSRLPAPLADLSGPTTTLLEDGRVLIVGGTRWPADRGVPHPPGAEVFDPAVAP